ncbi:hypothetical protein PVAND_003147 [Polypedilum vanderplanki]|uniref:Protein CASC3 n=1 Tax=Polypedilum vanderplanki TaxID=319348 RepID=A0A9J6BTN4_POLVA|nr:hypothetical protein PVAND_003147 [Polypedilum vanderplanki]
MTDVVNRNSADESEEKQRTMSLTENSPTSGGIESEYDTASTNSRSDNERDEYEDSEEDSMDEEEATDDEDEPQDDERESGDDDDENQEEQESEGGTKKKVDHDEDRSNPQYIPKKGTFYEHDDRTAEDLDANEPVENLENANNSTEGLAGTGKVLSTQNQKVTPKQVKKKEADRWTHDRFNEYEQAPKSKAELVSAYGYDIRNEDCPPRPRRQRRYGRHQSKYSRNWEDEEAYKKQQSSAKPPRRVPKPEDFPALGSTPRPTSSSKSRISRSRRNHQQDENDPQSSQQQQQQQNYRSPIRNSREQRSHREDRGSRGDGRNQRYNNDNSNNNNARHVKGKKNINFNHNIEFKNQNRKNINYESTQTKNNNVLNQQMQSSSHQHHSQSSSHASSHHQQSQQQQHQQHQSNQRYNNNEAPLPTLSFTNSKMNNATNNSSATPTSSRTILNFDNSSGNYGRGSREKEVNSHNMQQSSSAMSPNKNIQQQYADHQMDQMKLMEKSYQGKATNLNLNQVPSQQQQIQQQQPINNMQDASMMNSSEMSRSKRYSSLRQRSNINEGPPQQQTAQQQQQQQSVQNQAPQPQQYHPQYHPQQEIDPSQHVQNVMTTQQPTQTYLSQPQPNAQQQQPPPPQNQQQTTTNVQQQAAAAQKYQAAYYAANPASEYAVAQQQALMQAAMVEKYQYQQQTSPAQYLPPPQQTQQIYMPTQTQPTQQQQILNYVSTIQPQGPTAGYPQYTNYQNFNIQGPQPAASAPQPQAPPPAQTTPIYQTQSGLTYYPNQQIQTTHQPRIIQPQRRPNPIPILAPPDHKAKNSSAVNDDIDKNIDGDKGTSSAENIDHILDNMFVQRPMTNVVSLKDPTTVTTMSSDDKNDDQINDGMNSMSINDDKKGDGSK